ncbi:NlpC/P60 family protein [Faecalibaculum rodentium]|uniref:NlpC/P60 family protein n=1 Tax=Faecalibaculum rodentium TaxID=1702221 RepID=UPI001F5623AF|nr:NlpC/P60 family protein [Faecalibaculum rodentium]
MNFLENNSTKIAGILCTATMLPVAGTVMAMEMAPGWTEDDKYVTEAGKLATGWHEIDGETYYIDESGSLDTETTSRAYTAQSTTLASEDLKETIRQTIVEEQAAEEEAIQTFAEEVADDQAVEEAAPEAADTTVQPETEPVVTPALEETVQPEAVPETPVVPEAAEPVQPEVPIVPEVTEPVQPEAPIVPEVTEPVQPEAPIVPEVTEPAQPTTPVVPETPVQPEAPVVPETPVVPEAPVQPETPAQPAGQYDQLNQNIANAALGLVGVTNGWQCTEVVTNALNQAGVAAGVVWPDQYLQYGQVTDTPVAGNLIYYDQGGRGLDHIAIYIGNGQAVHGNFDGQTIVSSAYLPGANSMTFIQIVA